MVVDDLRERETESVSELRTECAVPAVARCVTVTRWPGCHRVGVWSRVVPFLEEFHSLKVIIEAKVVSR
jgi:hypothetical protein